MSMRGQWIGTLCLVLLVAGCGDSDNDSGPVSVTNTPTSRSTATPTLTIASTATTTGTSTVPPTATRTPTSAATETPTAPPTATPSVPPSATSTPSTATGTVATLAGAGATTLILVDASSFPLSGIITDIGGTVVNISYTREADSNSLMLQSALPIEVQPGTVVTAMPPIDLSSIGVDPATQTRCDPINLPCMLPWPNDHFTVEDSSTPTNRRLALVAESLPVNNRRVHVDPTDQNRADGWSPGSGMLVQIDGLDATRSNLPGLPDAGRSLDADSPIVVLDATAGTRHPFWAEMDALVDPGQTPLLMIHPAVNFPDEHRIVVGLRGLVDATGNPIAPSPAFAVYRDGLLTSDAVFEARRPAMEQIFSDLAGAGVQRADLQLAWDFTIASTQSLTSRMLAIRDDAFGLLGDAAPTFTVDTVTENPNEFVRRRIEGTFETPVYMTNGGAPGSLLVLDENGVPQRQEGTFTAHYLCNLPPAAESTPARMSLYGHGLLGDRGEVNGSLTRTMGAQYNIAYCATDWYGMADEDTQTAIKVLGDMSKFAQLPDRLQQGFLAFLYLGRLMKHPQGFSAHEAFRFGDHSALKTDELYFDGNSQGAILGGSLTAVAQDFTRSVLGEAGMNYSVLLDRSVDFDQYLLVMYPAYPKRYDRLICLELAQLLWDRGETDGYANHVTTDPLPGTPTHEVLLLGAVGDHQVSEYSLRVEAATMGAAAHVPIAAAGRVAENDPGTFLTPIDQYPYGGSAYFLWDTGSPSSPVENLPPREGHDPHDDTPKIPAVQQLKDQFWHPDGTIEDVCTGEPCNAPVP